MSLTRHFRPRLRPLEDRATPSCLVYLHLRQDTLVVRGDDLGNTVRLAAEGARVSVTCDRDPTVAFDGVTRIVADLAGGADRFAAARTPGSAQIAPLPLRLWLATGGGDDVANLEWSPGGGDSVWVDLGLGGDVFDSRMIPPPDPDTPDVAVALTVRGGAGPDRITSRMGIRPTPFLPPLVDFTLPLDGGAGNDVLGARFESGATQQTVADLHVALSGGDGNDALRLPASPGVAFDLGAVADGGAGFDVGVFSPGVRFVNVERLG
jgi:hypothetical protein